jgi:hypothetical protein
MLQHFLEMLKHFYLKKVQPAGRPLGGERAGLRR